MKNILVATDFSAPAENAAHYAIKLAKKLEAGVTLCNAFKVPADAPMAAQVAWPLVDEADLASESEGSLSELVSKLQSANSDESDSYSSDLVFESEKGKVCDVVAEVVKRKKIDLVVMGMAGAGQFVQWVLGSNSKQMIDDADFPVLYVPYSAKFRNITKIAFTTDLSSDDVEPLQFLCAMAKDLEAEIVVYNITSFERQKLVEDEGRDKLFFKNVVSKLDYEKISYENIWHSDLDEGFRWIRNNKEIDMIAMVHHQHRLIDKLVNGSYAHKLSRFTEIPLLIFQPCEKIYK
ncbi:universal stress protein [Pedobacter insulae]|uniref:Nucleotide-binding universal stress protein, UspA family n=1 Tax=Pedobacter insulae TaxID=414048 RepID=A0A1I2XJ97_9SPHI|nr:universal stress protein [Pedobacter insulae]SFH12141.1 Nucleotide-binding universal stress protein, UspA family [Pedobacter insulae]